jgi:hypothetical protein
VSSHTEESPVCLGEGASCPFFSPDIIVLVNHIPMTFSYAASTRIHARLPVRSSREGGSVLWLTFSLGFTPGFAPSRYQERTQELVTGLDTSLR